MGKHFTIKDRYKLEALIAAKVPVKVIADHLEKSRQSVYKELKRGSVYQMDTNLIKRKVYKADFAQMVAENNFSTKGRRSILLNNMDFLELCREKLVKEKLSPYCLVEYLKKNGIRVCVKSIYNWIHAGLIPGVTTSDLAYLIRNKKKVPAAAVCVSVTLQSPVFLKGQRKQLPGILLAIGKWILFIPEKIALLPVCWFLQIGQAAGK